MKSKKVTMLAAALVVAVVAAAGIGFATQYTASTTNTENEINSTYMVLTQTASSASYAGNIFSGIFYDTVNTASDSTTYYPVAEYAIDTTNKTVVPGTEMAKVSNNLQLNLDLSKSAATTYSMTVDVTLFTPISGLTYILILTNDSGTIIGNQSITATSEDTDTWTFETLTGMTAGNATNHINVALYISSSGVTNPTAANFNSAGFTNYVESGEGATPGSVFTFTVSANA